MRKSLLENKNNKMETVLKENLKKNVHIDKEFKDTLHEDILSEFQNKLSSFSDMEEKSKKAGKFKLKPAVFWEL